MEEIHLTEVLLLGSSVRDGLHPGRSVLLDVVEKNTGVNHL